MPRKQTNYSIATALTSRPANRFKFFLGSVRSGSAGANGFEEDSNQSGGAYSSSASSETKSPKKLTLEEVQEKAKKLRVKLDEEREDSIGIQSEPYYDREYNYPYETRKQPLFELI
jgi:hypothetical protein